MSIVAERYRGIQPSATVATTFLAEELKRQGRSIISLTAGEPDFSTPANVKEAAQAAIFRGATRYAPPNGIRELREAVREKFARDNGLFYELAEITVGCGAKQLIFNAFMATIEPGDEVIVPAPSWVSFADAAAMLGGIPVAVACAPETGFKLCPSALEAAITDRTKWLVLCSPSNPTGTVYSPDELSQIAEVLDRHPRVLVLTDHIYEHLVYEGPALTLPQVRPEFRNRGIVVNGVSKAYCMTGWRVGFSAGPKDLISVMNAIQSQSVTSTCTVSQWAAVEALNGDQNFIAANNAEYRRRRDLVVDRLNAIDGIVCGRPAGAFSVYPSCAGLIGRHTSQGQLHTDLDVVQYLLSETGVAVVHGGAFAMSPHFRLAYSVTYNELEEACQRISKACAALR